MPRAVKKAAGRVGKPKRWTGPAVILLAAAIAVMPMLRGGPPYGSDLVFHLASWIEAQHSMLLGIAYPHWAYNSNFGAGEPRFVFYPPLGWMTGAALGLIFPWTKVALAFAFVGLAATGLANRKLAGEWLEDGPATLAGCTAIFLGYALLNVYRRSDFAELTGGVWIPLLMMYLLRDRRPEGREWERAFDGSTVPLALMLALAWLSNGPAGLMASYLLVGLAVVAALAAGSWAPLLRAVAGGALGLGLAADFLVPAAWEQGWANLSYAISIPHLQVQYSWIFSHPTNPALFPYSHNSILDTVSMVGAVMLAVTVGGVAVAWRRGTLPGPRRWWLPLAVIPFVVLILMTPLSLPLWDLLPKLRYVQFSWRWLVVLEGPMAVFFASAVWMMRQVRWRTAALGACALLFLTVSIDARAWWFLDTKRDQQIIVTAEQNGTGVHGKREYAPPGDRYPEPLPYQAGACLVPALPPGSGPAGADAKTWQLSRIGGCSGSFTAILYQPEHKMVTGVADRAGWLVLKLRSYPAWRATLNGRPVTAVTEPRFGLMAVPVEAGPVRVDVEWTATPDVIAGRLLSVLSITLLLWLRGFERDLNRPRLS